MHSIVNLHKAKLTDITDHGDVVALTFFRRYKKINVAIDVSAHVKTSMCSETTKYFWQKYHALFVTMYITYQRSYLSQINTTQTSFEAYLESKRKSRDTSAP